MTGSANEAVVVKDVEPIGPKQLREFDAKLLQQVPENFSKEEMQHLIEHQEELQARVLHFGLKGIESRSPVVFRMQAQFGPFRAGGYGKNIFGLDEFYANVFGVDADFSRVRFPDITLYTYTTPIFVAPKLGLVRIFEALSRFGVECSGANGSIVTNDVGRTGENYVASFSESVTEYPPHSIKDEVRYRSARMALREFLLWFAYSLYRKQKCEEVESHPDLYLDVDKSLAYCVGRSYLLGTLLGDTELSPTVNVCQQKDGTFSLHHGARSLENVRYYSLSCDEHPGIRRVKLFEVLEQI
ncbi:MAG: hypothetical protein A3D65_04580 [Candidatus Lloydbacteria bacterium RIFCSPHIGHO2_02_FULL_50_13]|uniref:Uncharacterized protein n=1 Tax=Candidatus Lloydbacteria bacterium RIFCSPHIGHO2_02_FULL_50_13 TaxID=1798661 RepID=A0A1G2DD79_9BACT|nr:MAG: hypothetical protein A3D65_04580 [Candidatus Lloydbacteria bacterium RIFCSPHIGHO2_02_FULL_50_13]